MYRNKKILQSAKGQKCTIRSPWCNGDQSTTVAAHSNMQLHGKGKGLKAHDCFVAYACSECHRWLDSGPERRREKEEAFFYGHSRTLLILVQSGILK